MMNTPSLTIGMIGFGVMGSSMARNLAKHGHTVLGFSRTPAKVAALAADGIQSVSAEELGLRCSHVFLSLTDGASVQSVLFDGTRPVAPLLKAGSLIIDTTTIAPTEARELASRSRALGHHFVDAPVTGGDVGARNATLTIMCGGDEESFSRALPLLTCVGKNIRYMGPSGSGQTMKAINQVAVAVGIVAMTEAMLLAEQKGIDQATALEILQGGAAGSWALSNYAPRLLAGDVKPGFSAAHMLKDLRIALTEADSGCKLLGTETATKLFEQLAAIPEDLGNHALIRAYRSQAKSR
jgi:3-hydroxyisobutyrate dehydrogenase